jgi:uncharacterized protein (DUF433 family)
MDQIRQRVLLSEGPAQCAEPNPVFEQGRGMAAVDIGTLIVRSPEIRNGRPRVAGTGVTVRTIAMCNKSGLGPEEIAAEFPQLTLAHVYAALAYYYANREEIDQDIAEEEATAAEYERLREQGLF